MPQKSNKKRSARPVEQTGAQKNVVKTASLLTASCVFLIIACVALNSLGFFHMINGVFIPKGEAEKGVISDEGEITSIPEGEVYYRLNTDVLFENSYARGTLMFENPSVSLYSLEFSLYQPGSKTAFYTSPRLRPGECIIGDKMQKHLTRGTYACTCVISAYSAEGEYCGRRTTTVNVNIEKN